MESGTESDMTGHAVIKFLVIKVLSSDNVLTLHGRRFIEVTVDCQVWHGRRPVTGEMSLLSSVGWSRLLHPHKQPGAHNVYPNIR